MTLFLSGEASLMLRPWQNRPFISPAAMASTIFNVSYGAANLGR